MGDLKSKKLIYLKGILFLISGLIAVFLILVEMPSLKLACLLSLSIWCFCRSYYFAFYVIEHYVDSDFKYAGLLDFVKYMIGRKSGR